MAKDKSLSAEDKAAKKAAKAAAKKNSSSLPSHEKRSENDGVHKSKSAASKSALLAAEAHKVDATTKLLNELEADKPGTVVNVVKDNNDDEEQEGGGNVMEIDVKTAPALLLSALVPFANPLADEKVGRKVLRSVKKGIVVYLIFCSSSLSEVFSLVHLPLPFHSPSTFIRRLGAGETIFCVPSPPFFLRSP